MFADEFVLFFPGREILETSPCEGQTQTRREIDEIVQDSWKGKDLSSSVDAADCPILEPLKKKSFFDSFRLGGSPKPSKETGDENLVADVLEEEARVFPPPLKTIKKGWLFVMVV